MTIYKQQIQERKKFSIFYGNLSYSSLKKIFDKAKKGSRSQNILLLVEKRLDVALYRLSFASTLYSARQLIHHKKVFVNGNQVSFPSYQLEPGDIISLAPRRAGQVEVNMDIPTNTEKSNQLRFQPKPINFEVSYKLKKAIYLYSPQKIGPYTSQIGKLKRADNLSILKNRKVKSNMSSALKQTPPLHLNAIWRSLDH